MFVQIGNDTDVAATPGSLQTMAQIDGNSEQTLMISGSAYFQRFYTLRTHISSEDDGAYNVMAGSTLSVVIIGKKLLNDWKYLKTTSGNLQAKQISFFLSPFPFIFSCGKTSAESDNKSDPCFQID